MHCVVIYSYIPQTKGKIWDKKAVKQRNAVVKQERYKTLLYAGILTYTQMGPDLQKGIFHTHPFYQL